MNPMMIVMGFFVVCAVYAVGIAYLGSKEHK